MPYLTIKFECLVVDGMIFKPLIQIPKIQKFNNYLEADDFVNNNLNAILDRKQKAIYSDILDEMLRYTSVNICSDSVSTLVICNLDKPMYLMSDYHTIGLREFDDAMYIVEYRIIKKDK